MNIKI